MAATGATSGFIERKNGSRIAYNRSEATGAGAHLPVILFCGGFRSDMEGTKALYLQEQARMRGQGFVRFDYSGHGVSGGRFEDGTISMWRDDALAVLDKLCGDRVIIVGSSMGGWIALLMALVRPVSVCGIIGIAAAPDFTRDMVRREFTPEQREEMARNGFVSVVNAYSDTPYIFTRALIEDGEACCLLDKGGRIGVPVRLIQGMKDADVEWQTAHRIKNAFPEDDIEVFLVESGDHRLSRPEDLALIDMKLRELSGA